jgi:hypothetical protein
MRHSTIQKNLALAATMAGVQGIAIRHHQSTAALDLAQEFINDKKHTCDFAHRRMADFDQPNY